MVRVRIGLEFLHLSGGIQEVTTGGMSTVLRVWHEMISLGTV